MDFFMQIQGPSYGTHGNGFNADWWMNQDSFSSCQSNAIDDERKNFMEDHFREIESIHASQRKTMELFQSAQRAHEEKMTNHVSPSWPDQSLESVYPKQGRTRSRVHALVQVFEKNAEVVEEPPRNQEQSTNLEEMMSLLQERLVETSQGKEELERKIQLMEKELEDKEALGKVKIEELEVKNEKLTLEVNMLKEENATFRRKVGEVSNKNKELEIQVGRLEVERNSTSREFEDLARLFEEFEEECARKTRKLLMEAERKAKALEETKEALGRKDEALKIAKVKECDYIVYVDKVEKEVKELQLKQHQRPHSHQPRGSFLNHPPTCYFCFQKGHFKAHCFKFHKHEKLRKSRNRKSPPRVKQIWVRKDLVDQVRPKVKEKGKSTQLVWVVKKNIFPNLIKPPLVDDTPSTST